MLCTTTGKIDGENIERPTKENMGRGNCRGCKEMGV